MRITFVAWAPFISGSERSLQTTITATASLGHEVSVICPKGSPFTDWCREHDVSYNHAALPMRDKWHAVRWWRGVRQMSKLLGRIQPDLVHSNQIWSYPTPGTAARELGIARVCHMRDEVSPEAVRYYLKSGVEGIICISRHIEIQVQKACSDSYTLPLVRTMMNPICLLDPIIISAASEGHEALDAGVTARAVWKIPRDHVVFGFIGQIVPIKGLRLLIEALAGLADVAGWTLLVAGRDPRPGGTHVEECRVRVRELGLEQRVRFLGFLEEVGPFYRAVDLAVVPSFEEPLGRIPLEAASYGRPSVASNVGGLPETIRNGETGWLVPPGDVSALSLALRNFLDDPEPRFGPAARVWVESNCEPQAYAHRLLDFYRQVRCEREIPEVASR